MNNRDSKKKAKVAAKRGPKRALSRILSRIPWLFVFGSILIFLSWILENHFARKWTDELQDIEWDQITLDVQEVRRDVWNAAFTADSCSGSPSKEFMGRSAFYMIRCMTNISAWSADRFVESDDELKAIYRKKKARRDEARCFLSNAQYDSLIQMRMDLIVSEAEERKAEEESKAIVAKRNKIQNKAVFANIWYVLIFAIGSRCIGVAWMRSMINAVANASRG